MNPDKFFDYLEGNLSPEERARFEAKVAEDPQLQRELKIAQAMHQRSPGSREVLGEGENIEIPQPNSKLGPRLAAAFAALVALNVTVGLLFIIGTKKSEKSSSDLKAKELAARQQIAASLERSAETAFPTPTLEVDEIRLTASSSEREEMANNVVMLANQHGGSATKAPPDDTGITVLAEMPANRADEFRRSVAPLAPANFSETKPSRETRSASDKVNIYVRITQSLPSPAP